MLDQTLHVLLFAATLYMTGVLWFVQLVHYPLMEYVAADRFREYSLVNQARTTWVVGPGMLAEMLSTAGLIALRPARLTDPVFAAATALLAIVWSSTVLWQMPQHARLVEGYDRARIRRLAASNWLRTVAWTTRALAIGWLEVARGPASA